MVNIFGRRRTSEPDAASDITTTTILAFDALSAAARNPDALSRHFEMSSRLAAMIGALRQTYSQLPIDDDGPAMNLIEATADNHIHDATALSDALFDLIENCPDTTEAKMNVMIFMLSPGHIPPDDRPRSDVLSKWAG